MIKKKYLQDTKFICGVAIIINFFLAYLMLLYQQPFNVDGILYLNTAKAFLTHGFKGAMDIYGWPFYSVSIAILSHVTHFSLESTVFLFNAVLMAMLVVVFILLVKEMGGAVREQYFALLVILLYPYLNHVRDSIVRDFGYYAFLLCSLLFFMRYLRDCRWRYAIGWSVCAMVATLFRIEGGVVFLLAPFVIFAKSNLIFLKKSYYFSKLYVFGLAAVAIVIGYALSRTQYDVSQLGRFSEFIEHLSTGFLTTAKVLALKQEWLVKAVLGPMSSGSSLLFLLGGLLAIFVDVFLSTLGWTYVILVAYTFVARCFPKNANVRMAVFGYGIIILFTLIAFLTQQFFLSTRYVVPIALLLMLGIPFGLSKLYSDWLKANKKTWLFPLASLLLLITAVGGVGHFGPSKTYIIQAGVWIKQHTPPQALVYSNDAQVAYYSDRSGTHYPEDFAGQDGLVGRLQNMDLIKYDYLALLIRRKELAEEKQISEILKKQPVIIFQNRRGDRVLIFKVSHSPLKNR